MRTLLWLNFAGLVWRALFRFGFTASVYGFGEGLLAVLRIPVANVIAIIAGRRATMAYARSLRGTPTLWEKTVHHRHPTALQPQPA
jgi:bacteriophage N4 adsorption protein B